METSWEPAKVKGLNSIRLKKNSAIVEVYDEQLVELFNTRNPSTRFAPESEAKILELMRKKIGKTGVRWYFPWLKSIAHILPEQEFFELRTARNKNLINQSEQECFYRQIIGIAGLSVGSHAALTIAMTGGGRTMKLADPDKISASNLNRIRVGAPHLGLKKSIWVARQIYEINPYANLKLYPEGIDDQISKEFLLQPRLDLLIEEMDNPYLKIKIREQARRYGIPVIMATDNGDNITVDVERFDLNKNLPILHGILGKLKAADLINSGPKDLPRIAARIAGGENATIRMQQSVLAVGKTLYSWPQLGTAANLCGTALAYLARKIALNDKSIRSGRYQINVDSLFDANYFTKAAVKLRAKHTKSFLNILGL